MNEPLGGGSEPVWTLDKVGDALRELWKQQAQKAAEESARTIAAFGEFQKIALARLAEAQALQERLEPWNPNIFRLDGRIDTEAAMQSMDRTLGGSGKFNQFLQQERERELERRRADLEAAEWRVQHTSPFDMDERKSAEARLEATRAAYQGALSGKQDPLPNKLTGEERRELERVLRNPSQWGESGTVQVGRFTIELSVDARAPEGEIRDMSTGSSTETGSSTSHERQTTHGHTSGRSSEMGGGLGIGKDGPSAEVSGKVGVSEENSVSVGHGDARSTTTSSSHESTTTHTGEWKKVEMYGRVRLPSGNSVQVELGRVLVARQT